MNKSVIPFHERLGVVRAYKYVDVVIPQLDMNKAAAAKKVGLRSYSLGLTGIRLQNGMNSKSN